MTNITWNDLSENQKELVNEAFAAMVNAYSPYSHFKVGAALLTEAGEFITGANFENASYGGAICAERSALVRANAMGIRAFQALAVTGMAETPNSSVTAPCGICRQLLFEAAQVTGHDIEVILSSSDKTKIILTTVFELLPLAFGPADLDIDLKPYRRNQ